MIKAAAVFRIICLLLLTLPLMPLQWLLIRLWPTGARLLPFYFHRAVCCILNFRIKVTGDLPATGTSLLVSNHVSWIDILVLSTVAPLSFVAKREVAGWPFFGWLAKLQQTVFVDRERRQSTKHSRSEMELRLAAGDRLVLFPEGTSHTGAAVLPFKSSFFAAASSPDVTVIPVTLAYVKNWSLPLTRRNLPRFAWYADMDLLPHIWEALCAGPLDVKIIVHPPLAREKSTHRKDTSLRSETLIRRSLAAALHGREILE